MTIFVQTLDLTVTDAVAASLGGPFDTLMVAQGATIASIGFNPQAAVECAAAGQKVNLNGEVYGYHGINVLVSANIIIGSGGVASGAANGINGGLANAVISLYNDGTVLGGENGAQTTGNSWIVNSGFIGGTFNGVSASGALTLTNTGTIAGEVGVSTNGRAFITNTGVISGELTAIIVGSNADSIINRGTIVGFVSTNEGNDTYDGAGGTVTGPVGLGAGDDIGIGGSGRETFLASAGNDTLSGGEGIDTFEADQSSAVPIRVNLSTGIAWSRSTGYDFLDDFERVIATAGNDLLIGATAAETLIGGDGADSLYGGGGNDRLFGGIGADVADGGDGNDRVFGGTGNDTLRGGNGNDVLNSDEGLDQMTGGAGADVFVFTRFQTLIPIGGPQSERITDFLAGTDRLDVSGIDANAALGDDQAFVFIGAAAFTASGQLRAVVSGGTTVVAICTDFAATPAGTTLVVLDGAPILNAAMFDL